MFLLFLYSIWHNIFISDNYQKSEPSVTLKPDDNIIKDNINAKEENKEEKKEKEEHQSEDEDSDDDEEAVLESSP